MIALLLAATTASVPAGPDPGLAICRPAIARKAEGEIATITVNGSSVAGRTTRIVGNVTVFLGRNSAPSGSAATHHLIRADYGFDCVVRHGRVRHIGLTQP